MPPIFSVPVQDCTSELLSQLGSNGYRILALGPDCVVFALQMRIVYAPNEAPDGAVTPIPITKGKNGKE